MDKEGIKLEIDSRRLGTE